MKYSIFNSRIGITDEFDLLYNSFKESYLLVSKSKVMSLADNNTNNNFIKGGFIIDDDVDELNLVKTLSEDVDNDEKLFTLIVNPTLSCNFKCWYCYEEKIEKSAMSQTVFENILKLISLICERKIDLNLSFFGGEPFIKFTTVVKPLILYAKKKCLENNCKFYVTFTTNGSLLNDEIITFLDNIPGSFQITFDGDRDNHNKIRFFSNEKGSYDLIMHNIGKLIKYKHFVNLRINYTDKNIDTISTVCEDVVESAKAENLQFINVSLHQVWQNSHINLREQLNKQIVMIRKLGLKVSKPLFDNVRYPCYGDKKNSVIINYNGDTYKCTAQDFCNVKRAGFLNSNGELIWENDSLTNVLNAKFKNNACLKCRILPICNGACSQKCMKSQRNESCIMHFSDVDIDNIIIDKFDNFIHRKNGL